MADWFERAFGVTVGRAVDGVAGEIGSGIADIRDKLVSEGFFGRRVPDAKPSNDLGWTVDKDEPFDFEAFFKAYPEHFAAAPEPQASERDHDHGIDR